MKVLRETMLLFRRKMRETLRQPAWIVSGLSTPLLYLALFAPLLRGMAQPMLSMGAVLDSFVPGILALLAFGSGMGCGWVVVWEVQSGVIERLRVTPASRFSLLTAVVSAASGSLGLILKDIGSLAAVVTSLQLPITLLAGVLLPLSMGPTWLGAIAHFNPMYYAVEASRVLGSGVIASPKVLQAFLVMAPLTVLVLWWATRVYRKAVS